MSKLLNPTVKADTLAVLLKGADSITCSIELNDESCNVSLRFDDEKAKIAGYPESWKVWDEEIEGSEGLTYGDAENEGAIDSFVDEIDSIDAYVSVNTEKEIFNQLKSSLKKQFEDEMFKDYLTDSEKEEALKKIDLAIANL